MLQTETDDSITSVCFSYTISHKNPSFSFLPLVFLFTSIFSTPNFTFFPQFLFLPLFFLLLVFLPFPNFPFFFQFSFLTLVFLSTHSFPFYPYFSSLPIICLFNRFSSTLSFSSYPQFSFLLLVPFNPSFPFYLQFPIHDQVLSQLQIFLAAFFFFLQVFLSSQFSSDFFSLFLYFLFAHSSRFGGAVVSVFDS